MPSKTNQTPGSARRSSPGATGGLALSGTALALLAGPGPEAAAASANAAGEARDADDPLAFLRRWSTP